MAQRATQKLDSGDKFQELTLKLIDGSSLTLPEDIADGWSVLLFYRGSW